MSPCVGELEDSIFDGSNPSGGSYTDSGTSPRLELDSDCVWVIASLLTTIVTVDGTNLLIEPRLPCPTMMLDLAKKPGMDWAVKDDWAPYWLVPREGSHAITRSRSPRPRGSWYRNMAD
ncbi:MAG: hypothetical protein ACI97A_003207 [Planctomycetota bacterium]|jgi:hypothetical protein